MLTKEYKGYTYHPEEECDDDVCKIWHNVTCPDGTTVHADFSPYSTLTDYEFQTWIDLGMPERVSNGPLDSRDLDALLKYFELNYR